MVYLCPEPQLRSSLATEMDRTSSGQGQSAVSSRAELARKPLSQSDARGVKRPSASLAAGSNAIPITSKRRKGVCAYKISR